MQLQFWRGLELKRRTKRLSTENELPKEILLWNHWPNGPWVVVPPESSPNALSPSN